jgi:predicted branched-subunit amino acid permease
MPGDMRTGVRRSLALAASTLVLGVTFGALARAHGWSRWAAAGPPGPPSPRQR